MPIRPQELIDARPDFVSEDRECAGCGYNLKGLKTNANCPECGRPISKRRRGSALSDNLVHAPMSWLLGFKAGALLLLFSGAAFIGVQLLGAFARRNVPELVTAVEVGSTTVWWIGVLLVTRPRPVTPSTVIDPREEWFYYRLCSRLTQACWPVLVGVSVLIVRMVATAAAASAAAPPTVAGPPDWLYWIAGVVAFAAAGGLVFLCIYLSNLCYWAADTTLGMNFRACAWTVTAAAVTGLLLTLRIVFGAALAGPGTGFGSMITWPILVGAGFFITVASGHLLWCLWRLQNLAAWAVIHHVTAEGKDDRMKERAERMLAAERSRRRGQAR
jgi:hypothetical protein